MRVLFRCLEQVPRFIICSQAGLSQEHSIEWTEFRAFTADECKFCRLFWTKYGCDIGIFSSRSLDASQNCYFVLSNARKLTRFVISGQKICFVISFREHIFLTSKLLQNTYCCQLECFYKFKLFEKAWHLLAHFNAEEYLVRMSYLWGWDSIYR